MKIIKGDRVVLAGKDKGAEGVVQGHARDGQGRRRGRQRRRNTRPRPGPISRAASSTRRCHRRLQRRRDQPEDGKATRVGYKVLDDGSKIRVCKRTGEETGDHHDHPATADQVQRRDPGPAQGHSGTRQHHVGAQDREDRAQHGRR